ncbi:hypothetical protein [Streptobacillus moniliformis]|nr:hypothetical protein [Streptobacillus moniliformis]
MIIEELNLKEKTSINGGDFKDATNAFVGTLATAGAVVEGVNDLYNKINE